jgi:hypothetical protein
VYRGGISEPLTLGVRDAGVRHPVPLPGSAAQPLDRLDVGALRTRDRMQSCRWTPRRSAVELIALDHHSPR